MFRNYYQNGNDAFRLKLFMEKPEEPSPAAEQ
jgi:hypothetical protein